jgi:preprotein translocase SecE subunit
VRETLAELRKVTWPSGALLARASTVVVLALLLAIVLVFVFDLGASAGAGRLFGR